MVNVNLKSSTAIFPVYNSITLVPPEDEASNNLVDVTNKSALIAHTGDLLFTNQKDKRCPVGFSNLIIRATPDVGFTENLAVWWNHDKGAPGNTVAILDPIGIDILIKLKDKSHKFDVPTEQVVEMGWVFTVDKAKLHINPLTYVHLLNVVDIFKRPLAQSGDAFKLKQNERKHILKHATKVELVRKKGSTLRYWYDCVAVLSGSYVYFYPPEKFYIIKFLVETLRGSFGLKRSNSVTDHVPAADFDINQISRQRSET